LQASITSNGEILGHSEIKIFFEAMGAKREALDIEQSLKQMPEMSEGDGSQSAFYSDTVALTSLKCHRRISATCFN
jgi:hypothetical protein